MSSNNHPFNVLIPKGNQAVLPAGSRVDALGVNQIGVFDANTKLSIDGTGVLPREIFLAVGLDTNGDNVMDDVNMSQGHYIQTKHITGYNFKPHTAARKMVFKIKDYQVNCDTEYGVSFEFRNAEVYQRQGFVQFTKPYLVTSACCDDCETCPTGDANDVSKKLRDAINLDENNFATAQITARQVLTTAVHGVSVDYAAGDVMTDADVDVLITYNAAQTDDTLKRYTDVLVTVEPIAVENYCSINLKYKKTKQTLVIPSLIEGFGCTGAIEIVTELAFEQGSYDNIKQLEYHAGGWNGNPRPYRVSKVHGLPLSEIRYNAVEGTFYDQIDLTYDIFSRSGWQEHLNSARVVIAISDDDTTTRDGLIGILDAFANQRGFDALADDAAAAANTDETIVEEVEDIDDTSADGLG